MSRRATDRTGLAIVLSLVALFLFDLMGLVKKRLSTDYSAAELSVYRNFFGLVPSLIALWSVQTWHSAGRPLRIRQWRLGVFRGLCVAVAQLLYYISLGILPFATANTITYANALFLTALAVPILGEKVGYVRWGAVLIGFLGVVWIAKPGADTFTLAAAAPLGAAFCYALAGVTSRLVDDDVPTPLLNLYSASFALLGSFALALVLGGFSTLARPQDLIWIAAMGVFGGSAVLCLIYAYRMAEQSDLAPFSYFGIPLAFVLGWLFYGEAPLGDLFPGALLISLGGLIVIWRDRQIKNRV